MARLEDRNRRGLEEPCLLSAVRLYQPGRRLEPSESEPARNKERPPFCRAFFKRAREDSNL